MSPIIHVTLVDDNLEYCSSMDFFFEEFKEINFTSYCNAQHFLEKHDNWTDGFLLIDLFMPGIDGMTLLQKLKERKHQLFIMVISGHADQTTATKAIELGADEFLLKPMNIEELLKKILTPKVSHL